MNNVGILTKKGERECHVLIDGHVTVESVVLEYHGDVSVLGRHLCYVLAVDDESTRGNILKTCDHTKCGRLTTAGGTNENDKFAILNLKVEVEYRLHVVVVYFV